MAKSPMVETAVKILEENGSELTFNELWEKVIEDMGIDKETATKRIAKLYSDITLDKRIISLPDNKWDLRRRRKLDEIIIDTSDIIIDDEDVDLEVDDYDDFEVEDDEEDEDIDDEDLDEDFDDEELDIFEGEIPEEEFEEDIEEYVELANNSED